MCQRNEAPNENVWQKLYIQYNTILIPTTGLCE
uniref:Uncharacterized protein n=1 Tax=Anguilla anguilla TaxID=7936 RepID=A0A0E9UFD2_ANGAN